MDCSPSVVTLQQVPESPQIVLVTLHRDLRTIAETDQSWWRRLTTRADRQLGGVQVHTDAVRRLCDEAGTPATLITPFDHTWAIPAIASAVGKLLAGPFPSQAEAWRNHWHTRLLRQAIKKRRDLLEADRIVVYAQSPRAAVAVRASWPDSVPLVVAHHGSNVALPLPPDLLDHPDPGLVLWGAPPSLRVAYENVDGLVFVSKFIEHEVRAHAAINPLAEIAVIPNFLPDAFDRSPVAPRADRRDIITTGRLSSEKNIKFLLQIVAEARSRGVDLTTTVVGDGYQLAELSKWVRDAGIEDLVDFPGQVADIPPLLAAHRLYVHPSTMESFGFSVIEAMGVGLPVAVSTVGGIPEIVDDGVQGIHLDLDDVHTSTTHIIELLGDDDRLQRMGAAGFERVSERYTTATAGQRLRSFLEQLARPPYPFDDLVWDRRPTAPTDDVLSVGMATYNRVGYLSEALDSILDQETHSFHVHIVDDASSDDTPKLLAGLEDPRVGFARQKTNRGWLVNCNAVLAGMDAEYATLLGDDDIMLPGALDRAKAFLDSHPECSFVHAAFNIIDSAGTVQVECANNTQTLHADTVESGDEFIARCMRLGNHVISQTVMMRRDLVPSVPFDPDDGPVADFTLWLKLATKGDVGYICEPAVNYRVHGGSDSARWSKQRREGGYSMRPNIIWRQLNAKRKFVCAHDDVLAHPYQLRLSADYAALRLAVSWAIGPYGRSIARSGRDLVAGRRGAQ